MGKLLQGALCPLIGRGRAGGRGANDGCCCRCDILPVTGSGCRFGAVVVLCVAPFLLAAYLLLCSGFMLFQESCRAKFFHSNLPPLYY